MPLVVSAESILASIGPEAEPEVEPEPAPVVVRRSRPRRPTIPEIPVARQREIVAAVCDALVDAGKSRSGFAREVGVTRRHMIGVLNRTRPLTRAMADLMLEHLGMPAECFCKAGQCS